MRRPIKYNLILGVLIGFILAQIILAEGNAILITKGQADSLMSFGLSMGGYFKVLAALVFLITVAIFCTKKFRTINLNKMSVYLLLVVLASFIVTLEGTAILIRMVFMIYPNIQEDLANNFVITLNMFFLLGLTDITLFVGTFLVLVNKKVKYIKFLTKEVKLMKHEGFGKTIQEKGGDELAELCKSINQMSLELGEKIEQEKKVEKNKNELITNISHDLKTPLTSLIGYLEILTNKEIDEAAKEEYIKIAYNKSLRLKVLINELFEYTKLTSYDMKLEKVNFNLANLINQIVGESILDFLEKDIEVNLINPYQRLEYEMDVKLFTRAMENIIKNAEKYSDPHSTFKVLVEQNEETIVLVFNNKCEGLNKADVSKIFQRFYRLDEARSSENEGSGLGLTIARRIIELHGGELIAEKQNDYISFKVILNKFYSKN